MTYDIHALPMDKRYRPHRQETEAHADALTKLLDREYLRRELIERRRSFADVGRELRIAGDTVQKYCARAYPNWRVLRDRGTETTARQRVREKRAADIANKEQL